MSGGFEIFSLLYLAVGPGIALAVYLYYSDKWEPEPKASVIKGFLLGGLACFPTSYFEGVFERFFELEKIFIESPDPMWGAKIFYAFIGVALVEEACKFLFLKAFIYDSRDFSEPFDGIVYGGIVGCGFATVENLFYVLPLGQETGVLRMLTAVPGHAFEGIILGYFMGKAKFSVEPEKEFLKGLGLVVVLHGIYDLAVVANGKWSFTFIFAMVFLGLFFGLKAKKKLAQHSEVIEFSTKQYTLAKHRTRKRPLVPRDIRDLLSEGKLTPDDLLIDKKTGKTRSVKEIFSLGIISQYSRLFKMPSRGQPVGIFLILYGITFGFYFYFWFLRNYRDFRNYKRIHINPELKTLFLFVVVVIPYYLYGIAADLARVLEFNLLLKHIFSLGLSGIQAVFLYLQLRVMKRFLKRKLKGTYRVWAVVLGFYVFNGMGRMLPPDVSYSLWFTIAFILGEGVVLAYVQKDLNAYWDVERERKVNTV
ncbi:MAG: PrsW family glutamic-type intramembrane protease [Nitrospinota bacterium]|nr:PrsW family glutamic-type intramembrane protease [Nitrospinota bacterium]